ncbi:WAS/WASL-interacting protein family member 1-like [Pteropus medius]|uniref:WAS/WASL-interacting protein family member 1-like n=1 Tax=Pteropus vampyrus TaxID=132908 RepID=UPI00196AFCFF|nr:WAS/WASL-interacting protein family member 1-like [Pteropus giganteus]
MEAGGGAPQAFRAVSVPLSLRRRRGCRGPSRAFIVARGGASSSAGSGPPLLLRATPASPRREVRRPPTPALCRLRASPRRGSPAGASNISLAANNLRGLRGPLPGQVHSPSFPRRPRDGAREGPGGWEGEAEPAPGGNRGESRAKPRGTRWRKALLTAHLPVLRRRWPPDGHRAKLQPGFGGLHGGASLKEPESKGRKGRKDQSPALFREVTRWLGKVKPSTELGNPPQPRIRVSKLFLEMHQERGSPSISLHRPSFSFSTLSPPPPPPPERPFPTSPPTAPVSEGSYQEYRLSQLSPWICPCPDKVIQGPPEGAGE